MAENTPDCPEMQQFMDWFRDKAWPQYQKFYTHLATCSKCQQLFLQFKDQLGLKMIQTSDDELLEMMKKINPQ